MINRKYKSLITLCLACLWISFFNPKLMFQYYPTEYCIGAETKYYLFVKHTYLLPKRTYKHHVSTT